MSALLSESSTLAPEQYELHAAIPAHRVSGLGRRAFLKTLGAGLVIVAAVPRSFAQAESGNAGRRVNRQQRPSDIGGWMHIGEDGIITFFTGKTEVGQNIRTLLTQIVVEELPAPLASIRMVMADTDRVPWDAGTFGSRTTPDMGPILRRVAASARETLVDLAAAQWSVDRSTLTVSDGRVSHAASQRSIGFGELTKGQRLQQTIAEAPPMKKPAEWTIAGTSLSKIDGHTFVTGRHRYTTDLVLPGLLHGKVLRPPSYGATLASLDAGDAEKLPGVRVVRDGDFVGVTAQNPHEAQRALTALRVEWKTTTQISDDELFDHLRNTSGFQPSPLPPGENVLRRTYRIAYIAHAPLEPRAAVAVWENDRLTAWTGTQRPFGVRTDLAQALGVSEDNVRVIVPDTGSGYGGKHTGEAAIEAARLAKATGRPVKLVWTREEEFSWAYFRPAGVIDVTASVNPDGTLGSWDFHNINSGNSGIRVPYRVTDPKTEYHRAQSPLRQGSYRGLAATANHFARESHIDDLARLAKIDPLTFRLKNINDPRAAAVLEAAAEKFEWQRFTPSPIRGYGLAIGTEKGSFVATCVEIAIDANTRNFKVTRIVQAFECGAVINPAHVVNQNVGSILQGLGGALFEAIQFNGGKIENGRFSAYRVPRFADTPEVEVVLVNRPDLSSVGAGETPIVTIAPAIGNAVASASGVRLTSLPMGERIPAAS
jgi:nicotinate dehydrogenase subunit B